MDFKKLTSKWFTRRNLLIALPLLVALVAGTWYYFYLRSPKYSLQQIAEAVRNHDRNEFQKYVDVEGVTSNFISGFMDDKKSELADNPFAKGLTAMLTPKLTELAKEQILKYVESGSINDENSGGREQFSLKGIFTKSGKDDSQFKGVAYTKKDGNVATVGLEFSVPKYDTSLILDVRMRGMDGYWQVFEIPNFKTYTETIEGLEAKRIEQINAPIRAQLEKIVTTDTIMAAKGAGEYGFDKKISFGVALRNRGEKDLQEVKADLVVMNRAGVVLYSGLIPPVLFDKEPLKPGFYSTITFSQKINIFDSDLKSLWETPENDFVFKLKVYQCRFTDNTELRLINRFEK